MMTAKARKLGMTGTLFQNASGLPDAGQHSTARDLAHPRPRAARAFPAILRYFSTRSFTYGRQRMANHNRLLGRVKGIDGIKTGYTRASGFNLVTSVGDGKRRIVAVVMGGQTGRARDNHMADLIKKYLPKASVRGGGDLIAKSAPETVEVAVAEPKLQPKTVEACEEGRSARKPVAEVETVEEAVVQAYAEPTPKPKALAAVDPISTSSTGPAPSGWAIQVASTPDSGQAKSHARQDRQAGLVDPCRRCRLHGAVRQGRHHLLPRPVRRIRVEIRGIERLQRTQEKEDRLLRRAPVSGGRIRQSLPEVFVVEGVQW